MVWEYYNLQQTKCFRGENKIGRLSRSRKLFEKNRQPSANGNLVTRTNKTHGEQEIQLLTEADVKT